MAGVDCTGLNCGCMFAMKLGMAALAMSLFGIFEVIMYLTANPKYSTDATGRPLRD